MKYISNLFKGRINRRNFIFGLISSIASLIIVIVVLGGVVEPLFNNNFGTFIGSIHIIFFVVILFFNISLFVRRWHDLGSSGWMVLLNFIPLLNILAIFNVIFKAGQSKDNQYGKAPKSKINYPQDILGFSSIL